MKGWSLEMNEIVKVIKSRRSIRHYKKEQISDAELREIVDAALYAPNAMNWQAWHFTVIQDRDLLERLAGIIKKNMLNSGTEFLVQMANSPGYNPFYSAPMIIMISGKQDSPFIQIDCGAAALNITLAAESLNIGSCLMTSPLLLFASPEGDALREELGIPDMYNHVCTVVLGYKGGEHPPAPPRNKDVINYIR